MKIHAQINFPDPARLVGELAKQTRFALKTALNTTATQVRDGLRSEIQRTIDRPTPYTLNSLFIRAATAQNLEATVWLKDERATSNAGTRPPATCCPTSWAGNAPSSALSVPCRSPARCPRAGTPCPAPGPGSMPSAT